MISKVLNLFIGSLVVITGTCQTKKPNVMELKSKEFGNNEMIPSKFTCDGMNISPELSWSGGPANVKSFALICEDPDAPMGTWVHWVLFNIPVGIVNLPENFLLKNKPAVEIKAGISDFHKLDWGGPCPPAGTHRYFFKLYALDIFLTAKEGITAKQLVREMEGHIFAKAELVGKYSRK